MGSAAGHACLSHCSLQSTLPPLQGVMIKHSAVVAVVAGMRKFLTQVRARAS